MPNAAPKRAKGSPGVASNINRLPNPPHEQNNSWHPQSQTWARRSKLSGHAPSKSERGSDCISLHRNEGGGHRQRNSRFI